MDDWGMAWIEIGCWMFVIGLAFLLFGAALGGVIIYFLMR